MSDPSEIAIELLRLITTERAHARDQEAKANARQDEILKTVKEIGTPILTMLIVDYQQSKADGCAFCGDNGLKTYGRSPGTSNWKPAKVCRSCLGELNNAVAEDAKRS